MRYIPWQPSELVLLIFQYPSEQISQFVLTLGSTFALQKHAPVEESHIKGSSDTPGRKQPQSVYG